MLIFLGFPFAEIQGTRTPDTLIKSLLSTIDFTAFVGMFQHKVPHFLQNHVSVDVSRDPRDLSFGRVLPCHYVAALRFVLFIYLTIVLSVPGDPECELVLQVLANIVIIPVLIAVNADFKARIPTFTHESQNNALYAVFSEVYEATVFHVIPYRHFPVFEQIYDRISLSPSLVMVQRVSIFIAGIIKPVFNTSGKVLLKSGINRAVFLNGPHTGKGNPCIFDFIPLDRALALADIYSILIFVTGNVRIVGSDGALSSE